MPLSVAQRLIFIRQVLENTLEEDGVEQDIMLEVAIEFLKDLEQEEINNDRESASR